MENDARDVSGAGPQTEGRAGCLVALLGPLRVDPGLGAVDLGPPKQQELLAVLALHTDTVVDHAVLAESLWDGQPPRTYVHSLQLYVSGLRRLLTAAGSDVDIETRRGGYRLLVPRDQVDLFRFGRLLETGTAEAARQRWHAAVDHLSEALALWRGPVLAEFASRAFSGEPMAAATGARLEALESLSAAQLALGETAAAARTAGEVLAADGLRERARGVLMLALFRSGRTAEALRAFEDQRRLLDEELGALPSAELRRLHERILRHDEELLAGDGAVERSEVTAPTRLDPTTPDAAPAPEPSGRRRRRWSWVLATLLATAVAGTTASYLLPRDRAPAADTALLFHYGDGEVGILIESGFDRAVSDFGLRGREVVAGETDAELTLEREVTPGGLVLDFTLDTDIAEVARRHRDVMFVALDDHGEDDEQNLARIRFSSQEASYLAGFAAARTTETGTVGFIGGVDFATIWPFEAGFVAGAHAADADVEVLVRYLSEPPQYAEGFLNPRAGERTARRLFAAGADVVFAAAGTSGLGAFEAAATDTSPKRHLWAIGVDADQYETVATLPGTVDVEGWRRHILTSVVLRFDRAVYATLAAYARGQFRPGLHRYDLANGGVEISYSGGYLDPLRSELDQVSRAVESGERQVPCRPDRVHQELGRDPC